MTDDGTAMRTAAGTAMRTAATRRSGGRDGSAEAGRRSRLVEAVLACAAVLALCVVVLADPAQPTSPAAFLAVVGFGALVVLGTAAPRVALGLTILGIFAYYAVGFPPLGMVLPAVGALYLAASRGRTVWAVGGAVILLGVATYFRLTDADPSARFTGYEYVTELALAAAAIALGSAVRFAREARMQAGRVAELVGAEQAHLAERRLQDERLRIARDLHDTVGHQLTVAALHASVAEEALGAGAEPTHRALASARTALKRVRAANAETLRELRGAVRLLRVAASDPLGIAGLVRTAREAGLRVDLDVVGLPPSTVLPAEVAEAGGRILTEAVTNALRHASATALWIEAGIDRGLEAGVDTDGAEGRGPSDRSEAGLRIVVSDDGIGADPATLDTGHGIAGMRERAELVGGTVRIESAPGRGSRVLAELPLQGDVAGEPGTAATRERTRREEGSGR